MLSSARASLWVSQGVLDSISFSARTYDDTESSVLFEVRTIASGDTPSTDVLFSTGLDNSAFAYDYETFDIDVSSANIDVTSGDKLAFVLTLEGEGIYAFGFDALNNTYVDGARRCSSPATVGSFDTACGLDADLYFQTFVEVSAVPLPAGLPLLVGGLGSLALLRRRAKRRA